jgi:hypothetical protein
MFLMKLLPPAASPNFSGATERRNKKSVRKKQAMIWMFKAMVRWGEQRDNQLP